MSGYDEERLGRLLAALPPAPEAWVRAAQDLPFLRAQVDEIISNGLHEYLDGLQTKMNQVGTHIHETFFSGRAAVPKRRPPLRTEIVPAR